MTSALRSQLRDSLATLAMPSNAQLDRVTSLGIGLDELALEFDDVARARGKLVLDGELSEQQASAVANVEAQLRKITVAGGRRWTEEAVRTGEDWSDLRGLAQVALDLMA